MEKGMQTELPEFNAPSTLEEARIQCINLGNDLNSHAYLLGKILLWVKEQRKKEKKGGYMEWIHHNLWFGRATAYNYTSFSKKCDKEGSLLDYSLFLQRGWLGEAKQNELRENAINYKPGSTTILHGMFQDEGAKISDSSIDMVITDPPFNKEWLPQWNDLGELAQRVLVPGGYLFTLCAKMFLPDVLSSLNKHLSYFGLFIWRFEKGMHKLPGRPIITQFKAMVGFYKPPVKESEHWIRDMFKVRGEKDFHEWQAQEQPISYLIKKLTQEGDSILDPCGGSGTVAVVCERLNRSCTIIEMVEKNVEVIKGRLASQQQGVKVYEELPWTDIGTRKRRRVKRV